MVNRFLIISFMFLVNKISFASDSSINMSTQTQKNNAFPEPGFNDDNMFYISNFLNETDLYKFIFNAFGKNRLELAKKMSSRANSLVYLNGNRNPDTCEAVRNKNQLDEVTGFFHSNFTKIVDQDNLISLWTNENTRKLVLKEWDLETINAVRENREPYYLPLISKLVEFKLVDFVKKREQELSTKEDLTKHEYSLLFSIRAYNSNARNAARNAASNAAYYAAWDAACNAAWDAACNAASNAAWDAAYYAAWDDASNAAWDAAWDDACNAAYYAAWDDASNAAEEAAKSAAKSAIEQSKSIDPKIIGRLTYRVTEKTALLYFLENFETIVSASYEASMNSLGGVPNDNIFESKVKWDEFKKENFSEVENNPEVYHFLEHWIRALRKGFEVRCPPKLRRPFS